ncbi:unnamed protein product [Lathyrus sativus]|nr:unnamed protein product [Lathyrus sativus]
MQLETIFHMQEMTNTEYLDDQDAEEPDDFVISLTAQITRRDEEMAPFISNAKRNYIFGGICGVAANVSVKVLWQLKSINLFGVQQICRNSIALEQCVSRTAEMLDDALGLMGLKDHEGNRFLHPPCAEYICARKCAAPYVIQNLTSVPLLYHVYNGHINPNDIYDPDLSHAKYVQPGSASTIYMDENDEQQHYSPYLSSERLNEQRPSGLAHRYITVQLEGTYMLSDPISMDLVGLTCFNANFSKSYNENDDDGRMNTAPTFVVPVVLDVSALRYSKSIRIYSTVVLLNATSAPLELRFDIPFGVSPMIFDPIHPGQQ